MWIFGYGSLVWRPAFEHLESTSARVRGFTRRFWQGSEDHRGVPGAPGRVVTLVESPEDEVVGRAYRVSAAVVPAVVAMLDHREQGGYVQHEVSLGLADGRRVAGLTYVATADNAHWLGPASLEAMAAQIASARGPSGRNDEYLLRLEGWLREVGAEDAHVFELADALKASRR